MEELKWVLSTSVDSGIFKCMKLLHRFEPGVGGGSAHKQVMS